MRRLRVGVIGCGLIAQVMHLPYLREMRDRFEIAALCDISAGTLAAVSDVYGVARRSTEWPDLLAEDLDAVLVTTAGSHAPPAIAAARMGRHVFVEKPMCFTLGEADAMIAAAAETGVVLMVGNMKRFDPAYERALPLVRALPDLRLAQITTLEAPFLPYVEHYPLARFADVPAATLAGLAATRAALLEEALGSSSSAHVRHVYDAVLLDTLVHEVNAMRGLLGEPEAVSSAEAWMDAEGLTTVFRFPGDVRCVLTWVNLPELRNYSMELAFYGSADRVTLRFPSPFLRSEPTSLVVEGLEGGAAIQKSIGVSHDEAFRRELEHFYRCIVDGRRPVTSGQEGRQDLVVLQAVAAALATGRSQAIAPSPAP